MIWMRFLEYMPAAGEWIIVWRPYGHPRIVAGKFQTFAGVDYHGVIEAVDIANHFWVAFPAVPSNIPPP